MTVQEAIEKLKYIKYIGNGEQEYKKCSESIAIDMAIEALEKQSKLERVIERLEEEGKLADEERDRCARENPLQFDSAKGYATGIYNAIEIIKEELM